MLSSSSHFCFQKVLSLQGLTEGPWGQLGGALARTGLVCSALRPVAPFLLHSPGGGCHDAPTVSRTGWATVRGVVAHAEVVAHLVGHGGSHADGILRVVLHRESSGQEGCCPQPNPAFALAKPRSLIKTRAFNYTLHLPVRRAG